MWDRGINGAKKKAIYRSNKGKRKSRGKGKNNKYKNNFLYSCMIMSYCYSLLHKTNE